jgi:hypothetical protein
MAWLLRDGEVLASVSVPTSGAERWRALFGLGSLEEVVLVRPAPPLAAGSRAEAAFCGPDLVVLSTARLRPWRPGLGPLRARAVLLASEGTFERWGLSPGDRLELTG